MILEQKGYSYDDLTAIPAEISDVSSRSECNPFVKDNFLPIFASPMASVVNLENEQIFLENGIIPIIPRNITNLEKNKDLTIDCINNQMWVALSLSDFEYLFIKNYKDRIGDFRTHYFIVVDIANGHMKSLYKKCITAKNIAKDNGYKLTIMTGNIANPKTYKWICDNCYIKNENGQYECCIDYIRVGIGGGKGCITSSNVSIHYPQATLIDKCSSIKKELEKANLYETNPYNCFSKYVNLPKIVADGGIRNYDHVNIALGLGADYVMIGSLFAQCIESAGEKSNKEATQKVKLLFNTERYRDFEYDENGNWWAYYTDEEIEKLAKSWKDTMEKDKKDMEENKYPHAKQNYHYSLNKYEEKLNSLSEKKFIGNIDVKFFGMASADGQKSIDGKKKKTAEGITKWLPVKYTLSGWVKNMKSYLCSAMSYTNCFTLKDFIGNIEFIPNSISEIQAVNK